MSGGRDLTYLGRGGRGTPPVANRSNGDTTVKSVHRLDVRGQIERRNSPLPHLGTNRANSAIRSGRPPYMYPLTWGYENFFRFRDSLAKPVRNLYASERSDAEQGTVRVPGKTAGSGRPPLQRGYGSGPGTDRVRAPEERKTPSTNGRRSVGQVGVSGARTTADRKVGSARLTD